MYSQGELEMVADLCKKRDLLCISDEVYEWLTHDGLRHFKIGKIQTAPFPLINSHLKKAKCM